MNQPITIITGAGSGVGRSLAIALAAQGHHIALAGRTRSKLEETASQCSASPGLMIHPTDLRDEPSAALLVMESSALFDAAYAKKPANGSVVPIVDTLTMRPDFWVLK